MSKKCFEEINSDRTILRACFYLYDKESLEIINDDIERNIKIAIDLLDETPHSTIIFTSETKKEEYLKNPHFDGVKKIKVKSGNDTLTIINDFFYRCCRNE